MKAQRKWQRSNTEDLEKDGNESQPFKRKQIEGNHTMAAAASPPNTRWRCIFQLYHVFVGTALMISLQLECLVLDVCPARDTAPLVPSHGLMKAVVAFSLYFFVCTIPLVLLPSNAYTKIAHPFIAGAGALGFLTFAGICFQASAEATSIVENQWGEYQPSALLFYSNSSHLASEMARTNGLLGTIHITLAVIMSISFCMSSVQLVLLIKSRCC